VYMPLDYPSILVERVKAGELTRAEAMQWLVDHGVRLNAAWELMYEVHRVNAA
jgi:hypothetical protein